MVRGHGVDFARAPWRDDGHPESTNRLDTAEQRRGAPDSGQDAGGDAGQRWLAELQCRKPDARAGPLDAHGSPFPIKARWQKRSWSLVTTTA